MGRALLRRALLVAALASSSPVAAEPTSPWPSPARGPVAEGRAERNAACEGCHAGIAAEWRTSMHRRSFDDPPFTRALAIEPLPFCRGCHAPEADPGGPPPPSARDQGVACVTCHQPRDEVLAAPRVGPARAPHPVLREDRFATAAACAPCHEFSFPNARTDGDAEAMQRTVTEHARSPYAGSSCASCHMPFVGEGEGRHRSHAFAATRSPAALTAALSVSVARVGGTAVFTLAPRGVGHALPTGDLFRQIELAVEVTDGAGAVHGRSAQYVRKEVGLLKRGAGIYGRGFAIDSRLTGEMQVAVDVPEVARGERVRWRVTYQRIEHPGVAGAPAVSGGDVVLAEGDLATE